MNELDKISGIVFITVDEQPTEVLKYPNESFFLSKDKGGIDRKEPTKVKQDRWRINIAGFNLLKGEIQQRIIKELDRKYHEGKQRDNEEEKFNEPDKAKLG